MATFDQSFLQRRSRILGKPADQADQTAEKVQADFSKFGEPFAKRRQQILSKPRQQPARKTVEPPAVRTEPQPEPQKRSLLGDLKTAVVEAVKRNIGVGLPGILKPEIQKKAEQKAAELAVEIARSVPRSGVSAYLTATKQKEVTPGYGGGVIGRAEKVLLGDRKIKDFQGEGEDTIKGVGGPEDTAKKYGFAVGAGFAAIDLIPGVPKRKIAEKLAKEASPEAIKKILSTKVLKDAPEEVLTELSQKYAAISDPKVIRKDLHNLAKAGLSDIDGVKARLRFTDEELRDANSGGADDVFVLSEVLDFPELYKQRPELKGLSVRVKSGLTGHGASWNGKEIVIDPNAGGVDGFTENLFHELQHVIQWSDDMARGADLEKIGKEAFDNYYNTVGEVQAREAGKNRRLFYSQSRAAQQLASIESPKAKAAIDQTAATLKEPATTVRRVVTSLSKAKTKVLENVQNEQERVRKLMERPDVKITDEANPYLKATLYSGRVSERIETTRKEAEAIITEAKKVADEVKLDLPAVRKQINDYLYFRHAPERNAALGAKAAGITTKAALKGLQALEQAPHGAKVKELAEKVATINNQTLDLLKDGGVITDDLYTTLRGKYQNHVPLNRIFEETDDVGSVLSGRGFDVRSTGIKRAKGSDRAVDDILENVLLNHEQAVLRAEKNIVDQATLAFVRQNKDALKGTMSEYHPKMIGTDLSGKPIVEKTDDPSVLQLFENGKRVWIKVEDQRLATALRSVGREKLPAILNAVGAFTRLYAGLATRFNPEFALPNKIRDLQETAIYLSSQKQVGFKGAAKMVKRDLLQQNTMAVLDSIRGVDSEGARLYKELRELGGTTGGFGLSTKKQITLSVERMEKLATSKTARVADNLVAYVDNWNQIFEDSTRLSVYRQALEQKLSKEQAAFLAKEASINFNRMGKGGPVINAIYMFSNASIQGSVKMMRSLKNPKVLGATVATVAGAVGAVNEWNDRVDPEWREKIAKWDRLNGLPVVLPNGDGEGVKYFTIPVSWGIKPIKVMADYAFDMAAGQGADVKTIIEDTFTAMLEAYNPVGGTDLASALMPSLGDPLNDLSRNKAWHGGAIKPDYDQNAPEDIKYFDSLSKTKTGQVAISISEILQGTAGIAISPADLKYAFESYAGGAGRTIGKTVNAVVGLVSGKSAPLDEYPMLSRFYRERDADEVSAGRADDPAINALLEDTKREKFKAKEDMRPLYDNVQKLVSEGKEDMAQDIVDGLSDEEYELYEALKASDKRRESNRATTQMYSTVQIVQRFMQEGKTDQAQEIVDAMTDDEYKAYQRAKKALGFEE